MEERRSAKAAEREELLAEGRAIKARLEEERALLAAVKQLKLQELEAAGVPALYAAQLERLQVRGAAPPRAAK